MKKVLLFLAFALLVGPAARAQLLFTLDQASLSGFPGSTLTFSGTLQNTGTAALFLNGDLFTLTGAGLTLDDSPFLLNFPLSLDAGESASGDLFDVFMAPDALPGNYAGSFTVLGGAGANDQAALANQRFTVTAIPEPGTLALLLAGFVACSAGMGRARRRRPCVAPPSSQEQGTGQC